MATFKFYNFSFVLVKNPIQTSLFEDIPTTSQEQNWQHKQDLLSQILHNENLQFALGEKYYRHQFLSLQDEIYLLQIANNAKIRREVNFRIQKEEHFPSCHIIIDNRKDVQNIAIQELRSSFSNTNTIARILENTINQYLRPYRLKLSIHPKYSEIEFWGFVREHAKEIRMVRFHFLQPNLPDYTDALGKVLGMSAQEINGALTAQFDADKEQVLTIDEKNELQREWARLGGESGLPIEAQLVGSNRYHKIGKGTYIVQELSDNTLDIEQGDDKEQTNEKKQEALVAFMNKNQRSNLPCTNA